LAGIFPPPGICGQGVGAGDQL